MKMQLLLLLLIAVTARAQRIACPGDTTRRLDRAKLVDFHNIRRSSLFMGAAKRGVDSAHNVYALAYDCALEALAKAQADTCPTTTSAPETRPDRGENYFRLEQSLITEANVLTTAARNWFTEASRGFPVTAGNIYTDEIAEMGINSYLQMVWGVSTRIGCGITQCEGFRAVVCQYQTRGLIVGEPIVQPGGMGCKVDADCTTFPGSTCQPSRRLCNVPADTDPEPPASTAPLFTTTTTTTPATTTAFYTLCANKAANCDKLSKDCNHAYWLHKKQVEKLCPESCGLCPSTPVCSGAPLLTNAVRAMALEAHNKLRSSIAKGKEVMGVDTVGCHSMFALRYNCKLEGSAQTLAQRLACDWRDGRARGSTYDMGRGENVDVIAVNSSGVFPAPGDAMKEALAKWRKEIEDFNPKSLLEKNNTNLLAQVGHFAQMAYSPTTDIGCGYAKCGKKQAALVCVYRRPRRSRGKVYIAVPSGGCTQEKCQWIDRESTCNTTTGLCQLP